MQEDNVPKNTSKSATEWLKKRRIKVLLWPSQSPDLSPIDMLWRDLKRAVHKQMPTNLNELEQCCKEEWAKIPPQLCERLIKSYRKQLFQVTAAKGGSTNH